MIAIESVVVIPIQNMVVIPNDFMVVIIIEPVFRDTLDSSIY